MPRPRLITIGFSHYCEKARWALDRAGIDYVEDDHVPLLHWRASLGAGARRTVPALVTDEGVLCESNDILRFADRELPADRRLFPDDPAARAEVLALVDDFDRGVGPSVRRWLYFHVLQDRGVFVDLFTCTGPAWERRSVRVLAPVMRAMVRRGLNITPSAAARSWSRIERTFAEVEARLADGRRYLVGDSFSAADLTFAALAGLLAQPEPRGFPIPESPTRIPAVAAAIAGTRASAAGRFICRVYAEERPARA